MASHPDGVPLAVVRLTPSRDCGEAAFRAPERRPVDSRIAARVVVRVAAVLGAAVGISACIPSGGWAMSFGAPPLAPLAGKHGCIVDGDWFDLPPRSTLTCQSAWGLVTR
jgi:hypothetical protein